MAKDLNEWNGIGRLGQDCEFQYTKNNTALASFSLANNNSYSSNGERRNEVSFIRCVMWGKGAETLHQYLKKGKQVAVTGRLEQKSWEDNDGKMHYKLQVVVDKLQLLGGNRDLENRNQNDSQGDTY